MAENVTQLPVKKGKIERSSALEAWPPLKASAKKSIACSMISVGVRGPPFVGRFLQLNQVSRAD